MVKENAGTRTPKFLYKFLSVLDEDQVHKLHKIISGILDISAFSTDEIERLENRLLLATIDSRYLSVNGN